VDPLVPGTCSVLKHEFQPGPNSLCRGLRSEREGVSHTQGGMSVHTYHVVVARDVFGPVSVEHNRRFSQLRPHTILLEQNGEREPYPQLHFTSLTPRPPPASFLGHHCPMQATNSLISRTLPASFPEHYWPHSQNIIGLIPRVLSASFPEDYRPHSQNTTGLIPRTLQALFPGNHHHNWDGDYVRCTSKFSYFSLCFPTGGSFTPFSPPLSSTESDRLELDEESLQNNKTPHKKSTLDNSFKQT